MDVTPFKTARVRGLGTPDEHTNSKTDTQYVVEVKNPFEHPHILDESMYPDDDYEYPEDNPDLAIEYNIGYYFNPRAVDIFTEDNDVIAESCALYSLKGGSVGLDPRYSVIPFDDIRDICDSALRYYHVQYQKREAHAKFAKKLQKMKATDPAEFALNYMQYDGTKKMEVCLVPKRITTLTPEMASVIIGHCYIIRSVCTNHTINRADDIGRICLYDANKESDTYGLYVPITDGTIATWEREVFGHKNEKWIRDFKSCLFRMFSERQYRVLPCQDPRLSALKDRIFNHETKECIEFSPDYVFETKIPHEFPTSAPVEPMYHRCDGVTVGVNDILKEYAPYDGGVELLKQVMCACLRNRFNFRKMVTFYNPTGQNGKSTLIGLISALVGSSNVASSSLDLLSNGSNPASRFALGDLVGAMVVSCADSRANEYIKDSDQLKRIISHDDITIERKGQDMFPYTPNVMIICGSNDLPKSADKGSAWLDRQLFIPIEGNFKVIDVGIADWVKSESVGRFLLYELCQMEYFTEFDELTECLELKGEYLNENNLVVEFIQSDEGLVRQPILPFDYLYDTFRVWLKETHPSTRSPMSLPEFKKEVSRYLVDEFQEYEFNGSSIKDNKQLRMSTHLRWYTHTGEVKELTPKDRVRGLKHVLLTEMRNLINQEILNDQSKFKARGEVQGDRIVSAVAGSVAKDNDVKVIQFDRHYTGSNPDLKAESKNIVNDDSYLYDSPFK